MHEEVIDFGLEYTRKSGRTRSAIASFCDLELGIRVAEFKGFQFNRQELTIAEVMDFMGRAEDQGK